MVVDLASIGGFLAGGRGETGREEVAVSRAMWLILGRMSSILPDTFRLRGRGVSALLSLRDASMHFLLVQRVQSLPVLAF